MAGSASAAAQMIPLPRQGALAGLVVVDLTTMLAGPYCSMILADQGATVLKIEAPGGDGTRTMGPFRPRDEARAHSGYHHSINRNKLSIALDLKQDEGKEVVRRLIAKSDVLVENFRVGVMERLGLAYETLAAINPRLVYACVRGFGDPRSGASPYAEFPTFDVVAQAMGGFMGITGPDPQTPMKAGPGVGDIVPAMLATIGILAALRHAERTGEGQFVDVAMYDAMVALCERATNQYTFAGLVPAPEGNHHPLLCPFGLFAARDGWVAIACPGDHFWRLLAEIMEQPALGTDPDFALNADRLANRARTIAHVEAWTRRHDKADLMRRLGGRVPFGPVQDIAEIFADPHVAARRMLAPVTVPGLGDPIRIANTPIRMSRTEGGVQAAAPELGADADPILRHAGFDAAEIADLRARKIVL